MNHYFKLRKINYVYLIFHIFSRKITRIYKFHPYIVCTIAADPIAQLVYFRWDFIDTVQTHKHSTFQTDARRLRSVLKADFACYIKCYYHVIRAASLAIRFAETKPTPLHHGSSYSGGRLSRKVHYTFAFTTRFTPMWRGSTFIANFLAIALLWPFTKARVPTKRISGLGESQF